MSNAILTAHSLRGLLLGSCLVLVPGCLNASPEATFVGGRNAVICDGQIPACKGKFGGCNLDSNQYTQGSFPSARKLLVTTPVGDYKIRVLFFFEDRLAPGTETEVSWYEPGCADQYRYQLSKHLTAGDLFEQAGRDQVFEVEQAVADYGDHLIEFWSDATCRYDLRVDVIENKR